MVVWPILVVVEGSQVAHLRAVDSRVVLGPRAQVRLTAPSHKPAELILEDHAKRDGRMRKIKAKGVVLGANIGDEA